MKPFLEIEDESGSCVPVKLGSGQADRIWTMVCCPTGVNVNCSDPLMLISDEKLMPAFAVASERFTGETKPSLKTALLMYDGVRDKVESFHFICNSSFNPFASVMPTHI